MAAMRRLLLMSALLAAAARGGPCEDILKADAELELRLSTLKYLQKKAGPPLTLKPAVEQQKHPQLWVGAQYRAVLITKNPKALYQLIHAHLIYADRLLQSKDEETRRNGVFIAMEASLTAIDELQGKAISSPEGPLHTKSGMCWGFFIAAQHKAKMSCVARSCET